ncbi:MAG TPA: glycine cleavage system aminomethyltransferase GcvT [Verrucomicrobiae bacterium]|nr:glycine cleavage system aminomethyltransferase GcvT [Verrucomicrobiae bacterium]
MESTELLRRTPLYAAHLECGAKMVPFGGWEMPVQYSGILEEHAAVRERVGLFDISHMGELLVAGPNAERALNELFTNDVSKLAVGQAQYTLMCNQQGGIVDDLIFYRLEPSVYLVIVNAANIETDFVWMNTNATVSAVIENLSDRYAGLALQGPAASQLFEFSASLPHFHIQRQDVFGTECWVARTGYTGEDGFELFCEAVDSPRLWKMLLDRGRRLGIKPCGLGARDTLRLEMCYPLHGNDITDETTPLEAGLGRFVSFEKKLFVGQDVLVNQKEHGVDRKLVAFRMTKKSPPPRPHYPILADGRKIGEITSGTQSPTLGVGIGMGYIESAEVAVGKAIEIEVRQRRYPAVLEKKPILKRGQ